ncbi:MAG: OsmC family protein [Nitrososphaerota archaeon]|nr:OsmC family protein [Nitrososphaerota archaeon]MDG6922430.1 OsmC family protein [Nitrososphaerota archaeon]
MQASIKEFEPSKDESKGGQFPVSVDWVQNMQLIGKDDHNHAIVMDTNPESGGNQSGPTPGRLLLMAVAGCTSMDVVSILKKSREKLTGLSVLSRGVQNSDYPKYYTEIHLRYILRGRNLDKSKVERAIRLSEEKYCSVGQTVSGRSKIFIEYEIKNENQDG